MRSWIRGALALTMVLGMAATAWAATDLSSMAPPEIEALQKRLTDDGCYKGAVDGMRTSILSSAVKLCPDQNPILRIETGMHTATIRALSVDLSCRLLATGSKDKTVRLWSMPEGHLIHTERLPIENENGGRIDAVAVSPDGKLIAAGGWDAGFYHRLGFSVYLFSSSPGTPVRKVGSFNDVISHLEFSPDGSRLAVSLLSGQGVRVLDSATGEELMADRDFSDSSSWVTFGSDSILYASGSDGFLRRYGLDLKRTDKVRVGVGDTPRSVAIAPDNGRIAVGYENTTRIDLFEPSTLKKLEIIKSDSSERGDFASVAWSSNSKDLIAGGRAKINVGGSWKNYLRRWNSSSWLSKRDLVVGPDTIFDIRRCGKGFVYATADPAIGLVNASGNLVRLAYSHSPAFHYQGVAFSASMDGTRIRFAVDADGIQRVEWNLSTGTLGSPVKSNDSFSEPDATGAGVENWKGNEHPQIDGRPIDIEKHDISRSIATRPQKDGFLLGSEFALTAMDVLGHKRWTRPAQGNTWNVNFAQSGSLAIATYADGTVRWHRWSDGQELLALFVDAVTKKWVAWTPTGYYMASPGGEDLIGWQVNRGWEQEADFFPASRFRDKFNRPDVVRRVLTTLDEGEALRQADAEAHKRPDTKPLLQSLPPVITILSPAAGASAPPGPVELRYSVRLPSGGTIARVEAFVDGAKAELRGLARPSEGAAVESTGTVTLPMPSHDASLSLVAYGADGKASDAAVLALKSAAPAPAAEVLKPSLYALLVGVSHYQDKTYDLGYAAADARGFADALKAQEGRLYGHVEVKVLADADATAVGLKRGLSWLRRQTTAHDLAIVFAAGHGTTDAKGRFWFLPADMDPGDIDATAVSQDEIAGVLYDLPGRKLLFLDACNSGAALNAGARGGSDLSAAINDFAQAEGGVVAYAASTSREFSLERPAWGHGAFTKALIEGFGGGADLEHDGTITTGSLDLFVERRVKELTNGEQHAVMTRPKTVPDFPIAFVGR